MSDHPGVSIIQSKRVGSPLQLKFRIAGKQRKPAAGTCDPETALNYARKIAHIINNNLIDEPPAGTPQEVLRILGIRGSKLERIEIKMNEEWAKMLKGFLNLLYDVKTGDWHDYSQVSQYQAAFEKFSAQLTSYRNHELPQ